MTPDITPLGEYPPLPAATIVSAIADIDRLTTRVAELEAQNAWLRGQLDAARDERNVARALGATGMAP